MTSSELPHVHLKPGELLVTSQPCVVVTILGSCLAVTMFNPRRQFAAICHAMLPRPRQPRPMNSPAERFKYLSEVIPAMAGQFRAAGVATDEVEVKVFGGGNVITVNEGAPAEKLLGNVNIEVARELLRVDAFRIKATNVGGEFGRKILFNTRTGEVLHKHLSRALRKRLP